MKTKTQYAALPYIVSHGKIEVLLITRRRSKRWVIPKGWPEKDLTPHKLAELEALEEAGLKGRISKKSVGHFKYTKQLSENSRVICDVEVFPLHVEMQYLDWQEKGQRQLRWLPQKKAAALILEDDLADLIRDFTLEKKTRKKRPKKRPKKNNRLHSKISATL